MLVPDLDLDIMWKDEEVGHICIKDEKIVKVVQYECDNYKRFIPDCPITLHLLADLFEKRCWERDRADINKILDKLGLSSYNPFKIIQVTHGVDYDDYQWFRFKGENLTWKDVDPRREV